MNISLKPKHEQFIQKQLDTGRFDNPDQVIDIAFQLLETLKDDYFQWIEDVRQKVDVAITELDNREGLDGEIVVQEILTRFEVAKQEKK